jgi:predicted 2-oxoglutarate/Fe(II)-dependent dioxygenase YbiX
MYWIANFFSDQECDALLALGLMAHSRRKSLMGGDAFLNEKWKLATDILSERDSELGKAIADLDRRVAAEVKVGWGVSEAIPHHPGNFYCYRDGGFYHPHSDAQSIHIFPHRIVTRRIQPRDVSSVLYLNDNFEGGDLVFLHTGQVVRPKKGALILFHSGWQNDHQVTPVVGTRYCVANWFETTPRIVPETEEIPEDYREVYARLKRDFEAIIDPELP